MTHAQEAEKVYRNLHDDHAKVAHYVVERCGDFIFYHEREAFIKHFLRAAAGPGESDAAVPVPPPPEDRLPDIDPQNGRCVCPLCKQHSLMADATPPAPERKHIESIPEFSEPRFWIAETTIGWDVFYRDKGGMGRKLGVLCGPCVETIRMDTRGGYLALGILQEAAR